MEGPRVVLLAAGRGVAHRAAGPQDPAQQPPRGRPGPGSDLNDPGSRQEAPTAVPRPRTVPEDLQVDPRVAHGPWQAEPDPRGRPPGGRCELPDRPPLPTAHEIV